MEERLVGVRPPLVPHRPPLELVEPGDTARRAPAFHHPAIPPQSLLRFDPPPGVAQAAYHAAHRPAIDPEVVPLVRVQLLRPLAPPARGVLI